MFTVYIIQSDKDGRYYVGYTSNVNRRIKYHNSGKNRSTRGRGPWKMVYQEEFEDKKSAWLRERQIKKYKGGEAFCSLIKN